MLNGSQYVFRLFFFIFVEYKNRMLSAERFIGVFILLAVGVVVGVLTLSVEWITFKYVVPYWRRKGWPGWMFCSQVRSIGVIFSLSEHIFS